jgi:hypothetical protein
MLLFLLVNMLESLHNFIADRNKKEQKRYNEKDIFQKKQQR